jgi:carboxymethylenebutenolidase
MKHLTTALAGFIACVVLSFAVRAADQKPSLPPDEGGAKQRLNTTPRHGEMVDIDVPGKGKMKAFVSYPEVKDKAPVVIVIQEIFGLSDWIRGVADQLAAEGFIAIAPDLLSGKGPNGGGTEAFASRDDVMKAVRELKNDDVRAMLDGVREYGMKLPASNGKTGTIGFCWGGGTSFRYATEQPGVAAAAVYYGTSPQGGFENVKGPVMGFYGGNDQRVNATIEPAKKAMAAAGKQYTPHIYEGAGHGFLRQQGGQNGANKKATDQAWPETVKFLRENLK